MTSQIWECVYFDFWMKTHTSDCCNICSVFIGWNLFINELFIGIVCTALMSIAWMSHMIPKLSETPSGYRAIWIEGRVVRSLTLNFSSGILCWKGISCKFCAGGKFNQRSGGRISCMGNTYFNALIHAHSIGQPLGIYGDDFDFWQPTISEIFVNSTSLAQICLLWIRLTDTQNTDLEQIWTECSGKHACR